MNSDRDRALEALGRLSSSRADDREDWLRVGMALQSVDPSGGMLGEWDAWSKQSDKYRSGECERQWRSFKADGGCAIGTLIQMANQDSGSGATGRTSPWNAKVTKRATSTPPKPKPVYATANDAANVVLSSLRNRRDGAWELARSYSYVGQDGTERMQVLRFEREDGTDKTFTPIHPVDDGGWCIGDPPGQLPLYGLPNLQGGGRVYVVEGEKAADAGIGLGLTMTTSAHGSDGSAKTDWNPLRECEVVILPDNDEAGRKYADKVAGILGRVRPSPAVKVVTLPGTPDKGDIVEFIEMRRGDGRSGEQIRDEIERLADEASEHVREVDNESNGTVPVVVRLSEVKPEPIEWLWPGRVAIGKLTMIAGDPGLGKSFVSLDMAARVSSGSGWPDGDCGSCDAGSVVLLSAEDDVADTIRPRLDAAGADVSRVVALEFVVRVVKGEESAGMFSLRSDLIALERAIRELGNCRLVVIDPITSYLGDGTDSNKTGDIRGLLAPLAELASRYRVAVILVSHLNKGSGPAIYRTTGSLAFVAAARTSWVVTKDKDDPDRRLVLPAKNNIAPDVQGMAYRLSAVSVEGCDVAKVEWDDEPVSISADEALAGDRSDDGDDRAVREDVGAWLEDLLADGRILSQDVQRLAKDAGFAWRTVQRARKDIGATSKREGFGKGSTYYWSLSSSGTDGHVCHACQSEGTGEHCTHGTDLRLVGSDVQDSDSAMGDGDDHGCPPVDGGIHGTHDEDVARMNDDQEGGDHE